MNLKECREANKSWRRTWDGERYGRVNTRLFGHSYIRDSNAYEQDKEELTSSFNVLFDHEKKKLLSHLNCMVNYTIVSANL